MGVGSCAEPKTVCQTVIFLQGGGVGMECGWGAC